MKQIIPTIMGLLAGGLLLGACDVGGPAPTPTVSGPVTSGASMATAASTALSNIGATQAPTVAIGPAGTPVSGGGNSMATAAATALSGVGADNAGTPVSIGPAGTPGAGGANAMTTAATTALSGMLNGEEESYLKQVYTLATTLQKSPELADALKAAGSAATTGAAGGPVDSKALTTKLDQATKVVDDLAAQAAELRPPAAAQATQDRLQQAIKAWQAGLSAATTATQTQAWGDVAGAAAQMGQALAAVNTLVSDLQARGIK